MNQIAQLPEAQRRELFAETAANMNLLPAAAEKDFWVVWVLGQIFEHPTLSTILQFKGGTSLAKAFNIINRFSEDIDLILDWRQVTKEDPSSGDRSRTQQGKLNELINAQTQTYIKDTLFPQFSTLLAPLCTCAVDSREPFSIAVTYPAAFDPGYLRPQVVLEIGPLASWTPADMFSISSYAAQHFPDLFERPQCRVPTILARRTFWEKATILHQQAHRAPDKPMPIRYSRHYYDLACLAESTVCDDALNEIELLEHVAQFKQTFYPCAWARYDTAKAGSLRLIPEDYRIPELESDYRAMQQMIFAAPPDFDNILRSLQALQDRVNASPITS